MKEGTWLEKQYSVKNVVDILQITLKMYCKWSGEKMRRYNQLRVVCLLPKQKECKEKTCIREGETCPNLWLEIAPEDKGEEMVVGG